MKLDRARFLMLTGAISGAIVACTTATTNTPDAGGAADSGGGTDSTTSNDGNTGTDSSTGDTSTGGDAADSATCDDSVGSSSACATVADAGDAGACLTSTICDGLLADLKPRVAGKAVDCIVALPTCESGAGIDTCIATALGGACPDATGKASCDQIAATCGDAGADAGISQADCEKYTAGLTAAGRTAFVACMTESACFVTDPLTCLAQL